MRRDFEESEYGCFLVIRWHARVAERADIDAAMLHHNEFCLLQ